MVGTKPAKLQHVLCILGQKLDFQELLFFKMFVSFLAPGGTLTFACYKGLGLLFFRFKILNFAFFFGGGVGVVNYFHGYAYLSRYFIWYVIFHGYFLGCQFINVDFMVFNSFIKSTVIFWVIHSKCSKNHIYEIPLTV